MLEATSWGNSTILTLNSNILGLLWIGKNVTCSPWEWGLMGWSVISKCNTTVCWMRVHGRTIDTYCLLWMDNKSNVTISNTVSCECYYNVNSECSHVWGIYIVNKDHCNFVHFIKQYCCNRSNVESEIESKII